MPQDLLHDIVGHVAGKSPRHDEEVIRSLLALRVTNKALHEAVDTHELACARLSPQAKLVQAVLREARAAADDVLQTKPNTKLPEGIKEDCLRIVHLLDKKQQAELLDLLFRFDSSYTKHDRGRSGCPVLLADASYWNFVERAVEGLASRLHLLDGPLRTHLVNQVLEPDISRDRRLQPKDVARSIRALGRGLAHLDEDLRNRLVRKAVSLPSIDDRAVAIRGLSAGWVHLDTEAQKALYRAAVGIEDSSVGGRSVFDHAIGGLCAQFQFLQPSQQEFLFNQAIGRADHPGCSEALAGLAASLTHLSPDQQENLLGRLLSAPGNRDWPSLTRMLAPNLGHLGPHQRGQLLDACLAHDSGDNGIGQARSIAALAQGLEHLTSHQQTRLIQAAASLFYPEPKSPAIGGLAAGMQCLPPNLRADVVALVTGPRLSWSYDFHQARDIGALGLSLQHLQEQQQDELVNQAIQLLQEVGQLHRYPDAVLQMMSGLGASLGMLKPGSRQALIDTVVGKVQQPGKGDRIIGIAAMAGLGAGLQHLSEPQCQTLLAAVSWLSQEIKRGKSAGNIQPTASHQVLLKAAAALTRPTDGGPWEDTP
jgi:hypothetical protein